jgi:hypothetical protein
MNARALGKHFRSNVIGYIALFCFAISGTAEALPGLHSVDSGDIKNRQVKRKDLASNSVGSQNVIDGSLTNADLAAGILAGITGAAGPKGDPGAVGPRGPEGAQGTDLVGADLSGGGISIPTGYVPNGRCRQLDASVGGAKAGQAVLFSVQAALQDGVMIYGQRVPSDGHVTFDVCNFSGTTQAAISDLPVHVLTFE